MTCTHDRYRAAPYMSEKAAMSALRAKNSICYIGMIEKTCAECGADISHGRRVEVLTVKEYMARQ